MLKIISVSNLEYCPACRILEPILEAVASDLGIPITNLDPEDSPKEVGLLHIESLPTTIVMRDNVEIGRIVGAYPKAMIRIKLDAIIK